jgi:hypothetical protein
MKASEPPVDSFAQTGKAAHSAKRLIHEKKNRIKRIKKTMNEIRLSKNLAITKHRQLAMREKFALTTRLSLEMS